MTLLDVLCALLSSPSTPTTCSPLEKKYLKKHNPDSRMTSHCRNIKEHQNTYPLHSLLTFSRLTAFFFFFFTIFVLLYPSWFSKTQTSLSMHDGKTDHTCKEGECVCEGTMNSFYCCQTQSVRLTHPGRLIPASILEQSVY